jgi:cysteine-rich repeat protein
VTSDSRGLENDYGGSCGVLGAGLDVVYRTDVAAATHITLTVTPLDDALDPIIAVADSCAAVEADACLEEEDAGSGGDTETLVYENITDTAQTLWVVVDDFGGGGPFTIEAATRAIVCGDGHIDGDEECDDNNLTPTDGCTDACDVPLNFLCDGEPSVCRMREAGDLCAFALPLASGVPQPTDNTAAVNDYGASCGVGGSGGDLVYTMALGPGETVDVVVTPTGSVDPTIAFALDCETVEADACVGRVDAGDSGDPESASYTNETAGSLTLHVVVDTFSVVGAFTVTATIR